MAYPSPKKSLSVRLDNESKPSIHAKVGENSYKSVANFFFSIKHFIVFPDNLSRYNGYMLDVKRRDGAKMEAFVTCDEMNVAKNFRNAINRTFSCRGGILWESLQDKQLSPLLMKMCEAFWDDGNGDRATRKAALVIGRQNTVDGESPVYVFNEEVQIDAQGVAIPKENQEYVLMAPYLRSMQMAVNDKHIREYLTAVPVKIDMPFQMFSWKNFIAEAERFFSSNFFPFIMFLAGSVSVFHYHKVLKVLGSCSVPMAVGNPSSGKSTSLQVINRLFGGKLVSQTSGESLSAELMKTSVPVCWDDPTHATTLKTVLVSTFQRGGKQTKQSGMELPETSFLLTVNFTLDDDMRSFERTAPIWFEKMVEGASNFLDQKQIVFQLANTNCIPYLIRMVNGLDIINLNEHVQFFMQHMKGLPNRLPSIYSVYRFFARKIIELVDDAVIISEIDLDDYLEHKFIPYVQEFYEGSSSGPNDMNSLVTAVINAIKTKGTSISEISKWLKPKVDSRQSIYGDTIHMNLPKAENYLHKAGITIDTRAVKAAVSRTPGGNAKFRSCFEGANQDPCLKMPRRALEADVLRGLDYVFSSVHEEDTDMEQIGSTSSATYQDESRDEAEQIVKLQEELHVTKSLVHELKTEQEKQCQERKALEEQHREEMSAKDDAIVKLKQELDEAHQKIRMLESKMQTHSLSGTTDPIPAVTLNTLLTQVSQASAPNNDRSQDTAGLEDGLSQAFRPTSAKRQCKIRKLQ